MITHTWGICANKNAFHNTLFVEKAKNRFLCTQLYLKNYSLTLKTTIMADSQIAERVQAIIVDKLGVEASEVTHEASFAADLGADSLDTVELIMEFEKEFGISIPDDKAEKIGTVGDAIAYIEENAK